MEKYTIPSEGDGVRFADCDCDAVGLVCAVKAVISDILSNFCRLPCFAGSVLETQGVILGKFQVPVIHKFTILRHYVIRRLSVVPCMFCLAAVEVVCRADFEDVASFFVDVVPDI